MRQRKDWTAAAGRMLGGKLFFVWAATVLVILAGMLVPGEKAAAQAAGEAFETEILNGTYCSITAYTGDAAEVVIPEEIDGYIVQSIGKNAFKGQTGITEIRFPDTVESIGDHAFEGCTALTDVQLGNSMDHIGIRAFSGCSALTRIDLGNTKTIYAYAFSGCTSLQSVALPTSVTGMSARVFDNCPNLTEINYPAGWTETYNSDTNRTTYSWGDKDNAFASPFLGSGIRHMTVPEGVTAIPKHAFRGLTGLEEISLPASLARISDYAFYGSGIEGAELQNVSEIGPYAFAECKAITDIRLPEGITQLDVRIFSNCQGLTAVSLPESLRTIYAYAFSGCTSLQSVVLPDGVTGMSARVFENCPNLTEINYPTGWTETYNSDTNKVTYSWGDKDDAFASPFLGSGIRSMTVPEGVTTIPKHAFRGLTGLEEISLPASLARISDYAFYGSGIKGAELQNVSEIGPYAFAECKAITDIRLPEGITLLDVRTFSNCEGLTAVSLPESLRRIYAYAFSGCTGLRRVELPDGVTGMSARVFDNCPNLTEINYPAGWTETYNSDTNKATYSWGDKDNAFASPFLGSGIRRMTVPEGVTAIPKHAFRGITTLRQALLPESVTEIGAYAFYGASGLQDISMGGNLNTIGTEAFTGVPETMTIHGVQGSYAETFAEGRFQFTAVPLDLTAGSLWGSFSAGGEALAGVTVTVYDPQEAYQAAETVSDEEGAWTIPDLQAGREYLVSWYLKGYAFEEDSRTVLLTGEGYRFETMEAVHLGIGPETTAECFETQVLNGTNCQITGYHGEDTDVVIPSVIDGYRVQKIGSAAFKGNNAITSVVLADTVETVEDSAFSGCGGLTRVIAGAGLREIKGKAFQDCGALREVYLGNGMETIGENAFRNCAALTDVRVGSTETLGSYAFAQCTALQTIRLGNCMRLLGVRAFSGCSGLTQIDLGSTKTIYAYAFSGCNSLQSVVLPDGVTGMSARVFDNCPNLTEISYPTGWTETYNSDTNKATYAWGDKDDAFASPFLGSGIRRMTVPEGVTTIPKHAFRGLTGLEEISLPASLTRISDYAFYGSGIKGAELQNVSEIGPYAFAECKAITDIRLPEGITLLNVGTFSNCQGLTAVTLPESLRKIYAYAFRGCTGLQSIVLPDEVTGMSARVFENCPNLTEINYPVGWTETYNSDTNSATYSWGDQDNAFASPFLGSGIRRMTVPEGMTAVPKHAFRGLTGLEEISLPASLDRISDYAFYGAENMTGCALPDGLASIGSYAFANTKKLYTLELPAGITTLGKGVWQNSIGLRNIYLNSGIAELPEYTFSGCNGLISVVIHDGLATIGANTFSDCANLQSIEIPKTVTSVNVNAFVNCPKLIIYCYSASAAHLMAEQQGWPFTLIDDHEHLYQVSVDTPATCERGGSELRVCSICGYSYIELVDPLGHDFAETTTVDVEPTCTQEGEESRHCSRCEVRTDIRAIPMISHAFGEWTTEREATLFETGLRMRVCESCGQREEEEFPRTGETDPDLTKYAYACFTVVDAETLAPISGANLMVATENDGEGVLTTDTDGKVIHLLPIGQMKVAAYAEGRVPRSLNVTVTSEDGICEIPVIGLSSRDLVEGSLTATEMTLEEIIAAGIDVDAPENTHVYKYAVHLGFSASMEGLDMVLFQNHNGEWISGGTTGTGWTYYGPGGQPPTLPDGIVIYFRNEKKDVTVYPVSEYFYIIIYGEVKWTKEMYDVELYVMNHSMTDTLENCRAELNIPDGMQLAKMSGAQQSAVRSIGRLSGGQSTSIHWYLAGNEAGMYHPSVNLTGTLEPFHERIERTYTVAEPLSVLAGEAMQLTYTVPDAAYYGTNYVFQAELENVSDKTLYGVESAITGVEEGKLIHYSNGNVIREIYYEAGELASLSKMYFYPGDKIVLQGSIPIYFDSLIIQNMKDQMMEGVRQAERILKFWRIIDDAVGIFEDLEEAAEHYDDVVKVIEALAGDNEEMYKRLIGVTYETESIYTYYRYLKFIGGLLNGETSEDFTLANALCRVIQSIPVRFSLIKSEVMIFPEETTAVIPTVIRTTHVESQKWAVNPEEYMDNLMKVLILDNIDMILPVGGSVVQFALKQAMDYKASENYLKAVDQELKSISVFTVDPQSECMAWTESGNVRLSVRGGADTRNGKLCFQGNQILDFTPINGRDDTIYIDYGDGDIRTFHIQVSPAHTHVCGRTKVIAPPTETSKGLAIDLCDICQEVMDVHALECCEEHSFGEWMLRILPTPEYSGVEDRVCPVCHAVEYRLVAFDPDLYYIPINEIRFPDETFRTLMLAADTDGNGRLDKPEIDLITELSLPDSGIRTLEGIRYLAALQKLDCSGNALTELDLSRNTALVELNCADNQLYELDIRGLTALRQLACERNRMVLLDLSDAEALRELMEQMPADVSQDGVSRWTGTDGRTLSVDSAVLLITDGTIPEIQETFLLPRHLTVIEEESFSGLPIQVIRIPDTVSAIEARAFANCRTLLRAYIPDTVTEIGEDAFSGCHSYLVIYGAAGSAAETYANAHGILFADMGE